MYGGSWTTTIGRLRGFSTSMIKSIITISIIVTIVIIVILIIVVISSATMIIVIISSTTLSLFAVAGLCALTGRRRHRDHCGNESGDRGRQHHPVAPCFQTSLNDIQALLPMLPNSSPV